MLKWEIVENLQAEIAKEITYVGDSYTEQNKEENIYHCGKLEALLYAFGLLGYNVEVVDWTSNEDGLKKIIKINAKPKYGNG